MTPQDCSQPGSSVHGILQTRILEWVAISCSRGSYQFRDQTCVTFICCQVGSLSLDHLGSPKDVVHIHNGMLLLLLLPSRFSRVRLFATQWTVAHQAPLSMGLSWQEYWSGLPFPAPGDLPDPGIEPTSLMSPALAGGLFTSNASWEDRG